jgi:hypothetical protein
VAITIVNQSVGALSYTVFGGSTSGSGRSGGSGTKSAGSGTGGSGVVGSGVVAPGGTASGIQAGAGSYTVVFGWQTFPSYTVSASGTVTVSTSVKT